MNIDLRNGDCLDVMRGLSDGCIDLTVTSPTYDNLRDYNGKISQWNFDKFKEIAKELYRITKDGGIVVWVVGDATVDGSETGTSFKQALYFKEIGFNIYDTMIYEKPPRGAVGNNKGYWQTFEYMFVFCKGTPKTINLIKDRENKECRDGDTSTKRMQDGSLKKIIRKGYEKYGRRTNIWRYSVGKGLSTKDNEAFNHPTIFPEALAKDHVLSWSNEGDAVLDCFLGSGTTGAVCADTKRNFIGIEIDEKYFNIAKRRIEETQYNLFNM